jgi:hypothetical protein
VADEGYDRTFPGDPNPPAKPPEVKVSSAPASQQQDAGGGGAAPAEARPQEVAAQSAPAQKVYRVAPDENGGQSVYVMDDKLETKKLGSVSVSDASDVLHAVGTFNSGSQTWTVPEDAALKLIGGRLPLPNYLEAKWAGGEAAAVRGLVGKAFLDGKMTPADAQARGNQELLKSQLNEAPLFAWQGGFGPTVAKMWEDLKAAGPSGVARRVAGEVTGALPDLLNMGADAGNAAMLFGMAGAGAGAAATGGPGAIPGLAAGAAVGATYGIWKHVFDVSSGNTAVDMLDKGFDPATVKVAAPVAGAINGVLMAGQVKFMTASLQRTFVKNVLESSTVKGALARYITEVSAGISLAASQKAVDIAVNDVAAQMDARPDLATPHPISDIVNSVVTATPVMAVLGLPGAAKEVLDARANTAAEVKAATETKARLAERDAAVKADAQARYDKSLSPEAVAKTLEDVRNTPAVETPAAAAAPAAEPMSPVEKVAHETITKYEEGKATPEQVDHAVSDAIDELNNGPKAPRTFGEKVSDTEARAAQRALESDLGDTQTLIKELTQARDRFERNGQSTRLLDKKLNDLLDKEQEIKNGITFYEAAKGKAGVQPNESLLMKPATLESIAQLGFTEGRKEVLDVRRQQILDIAKENKLTQADLRLLLRDKNYGTMSDAQFRHWLEVGGTKTVKSVDASGNPVSVEEHVPSFKERVAALVERKGAREDLRTVQKDRALKKENYVRQLNELPPIAKMTTAQLRKYAEILSKYDKGDEALSPTRVAALKGTELDGVKTMGEARAKFPEITGRPIEDFQNVKVPLRAAATPDPQLRNWHPALKPLVDLSHQMTEKGARLSEGAISVMQKLAADAISERRAKMGLMERAANFIAPQQKEVMAYIENPKPETAAALTPAELKWADWWREWSQSAEDYLIKKKNLEEATRFSGKYAPHAPRSFLEIVRELKDVGLKRSIAEFLPSVDAAEFSDKAGSFLGFTKQLKQTLFRTGDLVPSKNMAQVMAGYMRDFYNKVTQDEISPVLDTLARSLRPPDGDVKAGQQLASAVESFTKAYANNKKGINTAGGMVGTLVAPALRFAQTLAYIHYIQGYYALQATVAGVKMLPGEFMALGADLAAAKIRKYTPEGKAILEKYSAFIGKGAFEKLQEPGRGLTDYLGALGNGVFSFAHKTALEDVLLGSMTKEEFKTGEISDKRLADIKLNAGRWLDMEGMSSIVGSSEQGRMVTQFKRWAVPPTLTIAEDAAALYRTVRGQDKLNPQQATDLLRLGALAAFAATAGSVLTKEMEDDTFTGRMIHYVRNDLHTMWTGLDPKFFFSTPVGVGYAFKLALDLSLLAHGEAYKAGDREGESKGAAALKRDLMPAMFKQFQGPKEN